MCAAGFSKIISAALSEALGRALRTLGFNPALVPVLAWAEITLGVWLLSGRYVAAAGSALAGVLAVFSMALIRLYYRGYSGSCGCFLLSTNRVSRVDVARNLLFLLLAVVVTTSSTPNGCIVTWLGVSELSLWLVAGALTGLSLFVLAFLVQVKRITASRPT